MLDIRFIKENIDTVKAGALKKHIDIDLDRLIVVDDKRRELLKIVEAKRSEQNVASGKITQTNDEGERQGLINEMKVVKEALQKADEQLSEVTKEWQELMVRVPNIPDVSVPDGKEDIDNVEIRTWGEKPSFSFDAKDHITLMNDLDLLDLERGAKVSGFRGYFLKRYGVVLTMAIWNYCIHYFCKKGYTSMLAPSLVRKEALLGTGYLPDGEDDLYKTQDGEYFSGTAEVPVMSYYSDEIVPFEELPICMSAFSTCYRREAGAHGKDTKGLVRVHEFHKVEQVVLCEANHETSVLHHEQLLKNAEDMMQELGLPYRVVLNCGGDLGLGQVKKYDIESWVPSQNMYRETHSASYFHDFQTRRLNIRYKDKEGKLRFAHSLNNTALATPRILVSIVENYQQADGSIKVPDVLVPYVGKEVIDAPQDKRSVLDK